MGECTRIKDWMERNCKRSCTTCGELMSNVNVNISLPLPIIVRDFCVTKSYYLSDFLITLIYYYFFFYIYITALRFMEKVPN